MLVTYGKLVYKFKFLFLIFGLICMAGGLIYALGIFNNLHQSSFVAPKSQSQIVDNIVNKDFGVNKAPLILLFSSSRFTYTETPYAHAVENILHNVGNLKFVGSVDSFYSTHNQIYVSRNQHLTYATVELEGDSNQQANEVARVLPLLKSPTLKVKTGGSAAANYELTGYVQSDLSVAEKFSLPITAVLLIFIFGSVTAASLPLALGLYGIIGALFISRLVALIMPMSVYVLDIVSLLGLGLGIDYSLFIVNRYREELKNNPNDEEMALCKTISTAGKTVIFSGLTVMIAVAGLIIFPINYIRSMGVGGAAAVLIAVVGSLLFLPSILAILGTKVDSLKVYNLIPKKYHLTKTKEGIWAYTTKKVLKRPLVTIVLTLALLLLAGSPFLKINFAPSNYSVLPVSSQARTVTAIMKKDFTHVSTSPIYVIIPEKQYKSEASLKVYISRLSLLPNVKSLNQYQQNRNYLLLVVTPKSSAMSQQSQALVANIRKINVDGVRGMVGGDAADMLDLMLLIEHYGVYAAVLVVIAMLVLFYILLGSIVIPIKTIILTTLSLASAFGVLVWIFQQGNLDPLLGITRLDGIDASQLVIIFALAFGLSMDYATFLFSRIREHFSQHSDMTKAIVWGVQRTGRIITSAAILLVVVIGSFAAGRVVSVKEVAIGLMVAVLTDVFIVRLLLVPASMKLLGKYNWWLPNSLEKLYTKFKTTDE